MIRWGARPPPPPGMDLPDDAPLAMAAAAGAHSEVDVMVAKLLRPLPSSEEEKQEAKEGEPPSLSALER